MDESGISALVNTDTWTRHHFKGTYSFDSVPELSKHQQFAIVNYNNHWIAIFRLNSSRLEVFDSLGSEETVTTVVAHNYRLVKDISHIDFSLKPYQSVESVSCGAFCFYFIYKRLRCLDLSFKSALAELFSSDVEENERRVTAFLNEVERDQKYRDEVLKSRE